MTAFEPADWPTSHLHAADTAFDALTCDPDPLTLDCDALIAAGGADCGLPAGQVPLPRLRTWLLANPNNYAARDLVWRDLVERARTGEPHWVIAAVGMAMPALIRVAGHLAAGHRGDSTDVDNEVLTGFLEALRSSTDAGTPGVYASLVYAGMRAGLRFRVQHNALVPVDDIEHAVPGPRLPQLPYGHPDLLIDRAATLGVIAAEDVQPWIAVRLERRSIDLVAQRLDLPVDLLRMRLARADHGIAQAVKEGLLSGTVSPDTAAKLRARDKRRQGNRAAKAAARSAASTPMAA